VTASPSEFPPPGRRSPGAGPPGSRRRHPAARARRVTAVLSGVAFSGLVGVMAANPTSVSASPQQPSTTTGGSGTSTGSSASSTPSSGGVAATPAASSSSKPVTTSHAS
jgi:hypothetical protein